MCLSAPIVEKIPLAFLACDMAPESDPANHVHEFYDDTPDGYIDRHEFEDGMARLGLSNASDSLDLNGEQWEALMDHVFSFSNPEEAVQMLPYAAFQEQIEKLAPMFTTLYDSGAKEDCMASCEGEAGLGKRYWERMPFFYAITTTSDVITVIMMAAKWLRWHQLASNGIAVSTVNMVLSTRAPEDGVQQIGSLL